MGNNSVFTNESAQNMASPERIDEYVGAVNPGVWLVVAAALVACVCVVVWGFIGTFPQTLSLKGYAKNDNIVCYAPPESFGDDITGTGATFVLPNGFVTTGRVVSVSSVPLSEKEIDAQIASDWVKDVILSSSYAYAVTIVPDNTLPMKDVIGNVTLTIAEIKPIALLLAH